MLIEKLSKELNDALRNKDTQLVGILRLLISELRYELINQRGLGKEMDEESENKVLTREAKKRVESAEIFRTAGRVELADNEEYELSVIKRYMPEQFNEENIEKVVKEVIEESGANASFGEVMKNVMIQLKGKADGKIVSEIVKKSLN
jgi:uncharacterized protein